jgi:hypothetical protein
MFECVKGLCDDYYIIVDGVYFSRDDIIMIHDEKYTITDISDSFQIYLHNYSTLHDSVHDVSNFVEEQLPHSKIIYNKYDALKYENIQQNKYWN